MTFNELHLAYHLCDCTFCNKPCEQKGRYSRLPKPLGEGLCRRLQYYEQSCPPAGLEEYVDRVSISQADFDQYIAPSIPF